MSTMGIVYAGGAGEREQLMLLRTLQDNERNIIGNAASRLSPAIAPKAAVSVINVNAGMLAENQEQRRQSQAQQQQQQQQQQNPALPPYDPSRLKKHGKNGQPPPIAVAKRNARERNRVKQVNNGFATLRQHIPSHVAQGYGDRGKKLSKVETLRMAVEYIRGLQRLLAEADGLDYEAVAAGQHGQQQADSSLMIPSPSGSAYSGGTHNGSSDILCMDEQQSAAGEQLGLDEEADAEAYLHDEEEDEEEARDRGDLKRFRPDDRAQNRLSENQNRNAAQRRRRNSPTGYFGRPPSFGDEENIEPTMSRNNNNSSTVNNNNNNNNNSLLTTYSPILLQSSPPAVGGLPQIKREMRPLEDEESCRSAEEDAAGAALAGASPYAGEILIENPETGRLVPLKLEEHEAPASAQLVYLAASAEGLPGGAYYKHEIAAAEGTAEFMDVVSWWEQEQGRLVHQLQDQHQQLAVAPQQRLTHV